MQNMRAPIVVGFPLKGEWLSPNTPGTKIPSHGTNRFGTRYAYDFIQVDWKKKGRPAYRTGFLRYLLCGVALNKYYCWGKEVYSPCDGIVVAAEDGCAERARTNLLSDVVRAYRNARFYDSPKDVQRIAGNYVIIKYDENVYAALCHLKTGSIRVCAGQNVTKGERIGNVGHSGNSFMPHLHFQLMDSCDIAVANGLPCAFETYEILKNGVWERRTDGIPTDRDRIRF